MNLNDKTLNISYQQFNQKFTQNFYHTDNYNKDRQIKRTNIIKTGFLLYRQFNPLLKADIESNVPHLHTH